MHPIENFLSCISQKCGRDFTVIKKETEVAKSLINEETAAEKVYIIKYV